MRLVFAIVSFVVAAALIGVGIAQKTIWAKPDNITLGISIDTSAPVTIIDGATLNANPRSQSISATGSDVIFAAYGRTDDVLAWVGDASYNVVSYDAEAQELTSVLVPGIETQVPSAAGSDLWLNEYTEESELGITINVPEDISLVLMSDGLATAPGELSIRWPLDNSTPWVVPLVSTGGGLLILGLVLLLWAINHMRSARGPRRKPPKMPKLPKPPKFQPAKPRAIAAKPQGRRSSITSFRALVPVVLVSALVLTGCSTTSSGTDSAEATPAATEEALDAAAELEAPAVTEPQAKRIVARIAAVVAESDNNLDKKLIATRLAGPALDLRLANYTMRSKNAKIAALPAIPSGDVEVTLPQQSDAWPRTVFAVIKDPTDDTIPPTALMLIQAEPRAQYLVHYAVTMEPGSVLPDVAPVEIGASRFAPDLALFVMPTGEVATAYGDILAKEDKSEFFEMFEGEGDTLRVAIGKAFKAERAKGIPTTAKIAFSNRLGKGEIVALSTNDGGAIVATHLNEIETVKPVEAGAAINAPASFKALTGKSMSTKGLQAIYGVQLLFYVPPVGSEGKIVLLGYSQGLIAASETK